MLGILERHMKKAAFIGCLFFCAYANAQSPEYIQAYQTIINGELEPNLNGLTEPEIAYLLNLSGTLKFILEEDLSFDKYEDQLDKNIDVVEKEPDSSPFKLYYLSEIQFQAALVHIKNGDQLESAWQLRQAYRTIRKNHELYPDFVPTYKTLGFMQVILGAIPEKYQWLLSLAGMKGSIKKGLENLSRAELASHYISREATYLLAIANAYILNKGDQSETALKKMVAQNDLHRLIEMSVYSKESKSASSIEIFESNTSSKFTLMYYMAAEAYLQKGDYQKAIKLYKKYLAVHKGLSNKKDSYYKLYLAANFLSEKDEATKYLNLGKHIESEITFADKYASKIMEAPLDINLKLMQMRLATDGGFYNKAENLYRQTVPQTTKDSVELIYRKARLSDKQQKIEQAKQEYRQTLMQKNEQGWYFLPNAALHLGYIYESENNIDSALFYYRKAKMYRRHQYKNSIDSKAEAAINRLEDF